MGADHDHTAGANRRRLVIAFALTVVVLVAEAIGSIVTGSLALLVDTFHALTDSVGLLMALLAASVMYRPATDLHTWGLRRTEVLSALAQAALLFGVGVFALIEGVRRLFEPPEVLGGELLVFGILGLVVNLVAILVLAGGRGANLNMRAAFLEVVNDALGSVGVIVSAILISLFGWYQADAVAGILIGLLIIPRTVILLRASFGVLLESTPEGIRLDDVRRHLTELPHVVAVHDLHVTRISSDLPVLTAHVVVEQSCFSDGHAGEMLADLQRCVADHFDLSIEHSTFQVEPVTHAAREHSHHD